MTNRPSSLSIQVQDMLRRKLEKKVLCSSDHLAYGRTTYCLQHFQIHEATQSILLQICHPLKVELQFSSTDLTNNVTTLRSSLHVAAG